MVIKKIEFIAHFAPNIFNLKFDIQDGSARIVLDADGLQMADVSKLLLLKGSKKPFKLIVIPNKGDTNDTKTDKKGKRTRHKVLRD